MLSLSGWWCVSFGMFLINWRLSIPLCWYKNFVIYCPSYTTQRCEDWVMQQLTKLHVSTTWGHLQACKIWYNTMYFYVITYEIPWFRVQASACNTDTTPTQPHRNSNTHRTKKSTTNVAIQQNSRKLLIMDILMSETCWAHKKWNKITSDIKLVFYSSTNTALFDGRGNNRNNVR